MGRTVPAAAQVQAAKPGMQMPDTATWTARTFLNVARGGLANATAGGRIHAIGGWTSDFVTPLASVEAH